VTGESYINTGGNAQSPVRRSGTQEISGYDDPPNEKGDCPGTIHFTSTLSGENTTAMMVANGKSKLKGFTGTRQPGTPFAYRNVHKNEQVFDYQKTQFQFRWKPAVTAEQRGPVTCLLVFQPEDNPDTKDIDESTKNAEVVETITWDGTAARFFTIDPDQKKSGVDGSYRLLPIQVTDFKAEDYGTGIETSGTYGDVNLQPGDVVVWGRSLVSAIVKVPNGFSNTIIEPRIVQDVTPNRSRIFTTPTSQGYTREIMQYQNQKVLDNVLDESWVEIITIRRLAQDVLIESRDQPAQGGGPQHSGIIIADKFDAYLQCNVFGQGWSTYGKVEWRFNANLSRSGRTWTGSAAITGGTGRLTAEQPVMQPNIHPVLFVPQ
jgi:hypothetical protein